MVDGMGSSAAFRNCNLDYLKHVNYCRISSLVGLDIKFRVVPVNIPMEEQLIKSKAPDFS